MKVLISIQQPVKQWQIPPEGVATLRARFPHIEFNHATTDEARARALHRAAEHVDRTANARLALHWKLAISD